MLQTIPGLERIRFTSGHPSGCTDELVRAFAEMPKVCRHLHLPVQSGSDRVLKEMGSNVVILGVDRQACEGVDFVVSDRNAAAATAKPMTGSFGWRLIR